jgi:hypothetical protein
MPKVNHDKTVKKALIKDKIMDSAMFEILIYCLENRKG